MPYNENTDYANAVIYTITKGENIYVGSTVDLKKRMYHHHFYYKNNMSKKLYDAIRASGGWNNWEVKEYEKFPCNTLAELHKREDEVRILLNASLNLIKSIAYADDRQKYREARREELRQKQREYVAENREQVRAKQKEMVKCECGMLITKSNLSRHKKTHTIVV